MRVGNVKEIVFSKDPKQMNWLREDFPYAEVKCPPEFSAEVQNEKNGDVLTTKIVVSYNGAHPLSCAMMRGISEQLLKSRFC